MKLLKSRLFSSAVLLCGVVFLWLGVMRGENAIVLRKAVNICLECIGIG